MHHECPALAAQVDRPEEEVLLVLIHLPRQCGLNNLRHKLTVRGQYRKTVSEGKQLSNAATLHCVVTELLPVKTF